MLKLTLIGYWHSVAEPFWPDPAWFVDHDWAPSERDQILAYLHDGVALWAAGGLSWCRFRCAQRACGCAEMSDGRFVWPEGLAHYVECHGVRPPPEFIAQALASDATITDEFRSTVHLLGPDDISVDTSWWMHQRGFHPGKTFLSPARRGTFSVRSMVGTPKLDLIRRVRRLPETQSLSLPMLLERLGSGEAVPVLSSVFETPVPQELSDLEAAGLVIEFLPDRSQG